MTNFYTKIVATLMALFALVPSFAQEAGEGQTLYGFVLGVGVNADTQKYGFVKFNTSDLTKVDYLKTVTMWTPMVCAAEYLDGKIYAYTVDWDSDFGGYSSSAFEVYDATTFKSESSVNRSSEQRVLDMAYDYATNTMYALAEDAVSTNEKTGATSLCIVDLATGKLTRVGSPDIPQATDGYNRLVNNTLITLAADNNGNLYAMSEYRYFFKLDKFTGKATQVGERHSLATDNQFQSMTFGTDGVLYWAQKTPDYGWLTTIDPTTGVPVKQGTIGDDYQISGLYVPRDLDKSFPNAVTGLKAVNDAVEHNKVTLTWTLPTTDAAGNATTIKEVRVYRLGTSEPIAVLPGTATSYVDAESANGFSNYEVVAVNDKAPGTPATVNVFAGYDQLKGVTGITTQRDDNKVTISWSKPTATVNGKWTDYDNIVYNVYRVDLGTGDYIRVSENQAETTYTDVLPDAGTYTYVIEAVSGGVVGLGARSETVVYAKTYSIPYSTGFEDNQDGLFWTAIGNPSAYYGWSITTSKYSALDGKYAQFKTGGKSTPVDAWLVSPGISFTKGTYTLTYYANGGSSDTHSWEVMLGQRQDDLSSYQVEIDRHEEVKVNGWENKFTANFDVPANGVFYIGLHGFTKSTYASLRIDNLSIVASATGIGDVKAAEGKISVSGGVATVDAAAAVKTWTLTNVRGQVVMGGAGNGSAHLEVGLSAVPAGLYIMSVKTTDGGALVQKIVVGK